MMQLDPDVCYRALSTRDARFDGRVFVGVLTTGIYCRPICPARTPKRQNVRFFPTAAAAHEAGFRPCLRCRPELSPDCAAWRGASNTVSRALALIEAGALEGRSVDDLADRLGVGARQLRRLFRRHLGASPVAVAQTRRVHLAKQLIQDTDLGMAEVALAAGFGSVRRFNETFSTLFRRPPASLRRGKARASEAAPITLTLAYRPPYDWDAMLAFLAQRAVAGVETIAEGRYARSFRVGDLEGFIVVEPATGSRLRVQASLARVDRLPTVIAGVRRLFDLAADPVQIGEHLAEDPLLQPLVAARPGLRSPGAWDGFELAVRAILGQQITVSAAARLGARLAESFGAETIDPAARALGLTRLFPGPQDLAGRDIAALGLMPAARAGAISGLAARVAEAPSVLGPRGELDDIVTALRALPGVGEWTAQYIAMRALQETDAFPAADAGLLRAMEIACGRRPSPVELLGRAERWRPWRAYAAAHLWALAGAAASSGESTQRRRAA
jgi:AraC family transcriptional regulator of adaptative response / DNA-3-methyladenine glycosylase II